jgi:hypothetical protein
MALMTNTVPMRCGVPQVSQPLQPFYQRRQAVPDGIHTRCSVLHLQKVKNAAPADRLMLLRCDLGWLSLGEVVTVVGD